MRKYSFQFFIQLDMMNSLQSQYSETKTSHFLCYKGQFNKEYYVHQT